MLQSALSWRGWSRDGCDKALQNTVDQSIELTMLSCRLSSCHSFPQPPVSPFQSAHYCFHGQKCFGFDFFFFFFGEISTNASTWLSSGNKPQCSAPESPKKKKKQILCMVASSGQPPAVSTGMDNPEVQTPDVQCPPASEMPSLLWQQQSGLGLLFLKAQLNSNPNTGLKWYEMELSQD